MKSILLACFACTAALLFSGCAGKENFVSKSEQELDAMEDTAAQGAQKFKQGDLRTSEEVFKELAKERTVSQALYLYELASIKIMENKFDEAHELLLKIKNETDFVTDKKSSDKAQSLWHGEQNKVFKGDPYERATLHLMLALSFLRKNDPENAFACIKNGLLFDGDSEKGEFSSDFALLQLVGAMCLERMGQHTEALEWQQQAAKSLKVRGYELPVNKDGALVLDETCFQAFLTPKANTMIMIWAGTGPSMIRRGEFNENRIIVPGVMNLDSLVLTDCHSQRRYLLVPRAGDLNFQAMTRGNRLMNDILKQKAAWKIFFNVAATALVTTGTVMVAQSNSSAALLAVGISCIVVGGTTYIIAACVNPAADSRHWKNLPGEFCMLPLYLPPGKYRFFADGYIRADHVVRKAVDFEVRPNVPLNLVNVNFRAEGEMVNNRQTAADFQIKEQFGTILSKNIQIMELSKSTAFENEDDFAASMIAATKEK